MIYTCSGNYNKVINERIAEKEAEVAEIKRLLEEEQGPVLTKALALRALRNPTDLQIKHLGALNLLINAGIDKIYDLQERGSGYLFVNTITEKALRIDSSGSIGDWYLNGNYWTECIYDTLEELLDDVPILLKKMGR